MNKNKKAIFQVPASIVDAVAIAGIMIILFVFIILIYAFASEGGIKQVKGASSDVDGNVVFLNYLRAPDASGSAKNNADMIVEHYLNNNLEEMYNPLKDFFDPVYNIKGTNHWRTWRIKIYLMPENKELFNKVGSLGINRRGFSVTLMSNLSIPLPSQTDYLIVNLYKEGTGNALDKEIYRK